MTAAITIAVCTRERPHELAGCLLSLCAQIKPGDELLVVDNAPRNNATRAIAERSGASYVVEPRGGVRFARNRALAAACHEVIAFIDDDCRPEPGWLETLRRAFSHDGIACCTGPLLALETVTPAQTLMEKRGGFNRGGQRQHYTRHSHCKIWPHFPVQSWLFGSGGNMAFRRRDLILAGGFSAELPWGEDLDAFFRILRDGHTLIYEPQAVVRHRHVRTMAELRQRLYRWGWAYGAFLTKVAVNEPHYRQRAVRELLGCLRWHWQERCHPALMGNGEFPLSLCIAEMVGLLGGGPGYLRRRVQEKWRARRTSIPDAVA